MDTWLVYKQSLTEKLRATAGDARLEVLDQRWELANAWDQNTLKLPNTQVLHREILMRAFDSPCWYARTILPEATWESNTTLFGRLKTEPLGHLIFDSNEIKRVSLRHYKISPDSVEYSWLNESMHQGASELWVRLSEFVVHQSVRAEEERSDVLKGSARTDQTFFLAEILLPGLLRYIS